MFVDFMPPVIFMSVNFMPGHLVRQLHVRQINVRHFQSTQNYLRCTYFSPQLLRVYACFLEYGVLCVMLL